MQKINFKNKIKKFKNDIDKTEKLNYDIDKIKNEIKQYQNTKERITYENRHQIKPSTNDGHRSLLPKRRRTILLSYR